VLSIAGSPSQNFDLDLLMQRRIDLPTKKMQVYRVPAGIGKATPLPPRSFVPRKAGRSTAVVRSLPGQDQAPTEPVAVSPVVPVVPVQPGVPEAVYQTPGVADPRLYQQVQPRAQEYYAPPPPGYYPYAPPPVKEETGAGIPWFIWVGVGFVGANIFTKVMEFARNPQKAMMEMAMKQMSGSMGAGGASPFGKPGASPFGAPGASPFGAPGASPFGAPGANPFAPGANPFAGFPSAAAGATAPPSATVDVPASSVGGSAAAGAAATAAAEAKKGEKFSARLNGEGRAADAPKDTSKPLDVVEPVVKEPASSNGSASSSTSTSTSSTSSRPKSSFFTDVSAEEKRATAAAAAASTANFFEQQQQQQQQQQGGNGSDAGSAGMMSQMMEQMLRNPDMQKMLYPYLPEPMRNPQSIEWMLSNPEVKKQMEQMFAQQGVSMSPQMMDMMKNMDFSQDKVNKQFSELGLKPEDVISKVMANPELAAGFSNPKVQAAILDISNNPMNIMKYQEDPEVMKVLEQVSELFGPQVQGSLNNMGMGNRN